MQAEEKSDFHADVLDSGYVKLIDIMGDDQRIVDAARVSFNGRGNSTTAQLIDYLMRMGHSSPFEQVEFVFEIQCPLFVARQFFRHRVANVYEANEVSARYTEMAEIFHIPEVVRSQSATNKQGSGEPVSATNAHLFLKGLRRTNTDAYEFYKEAIAAGVAREQARAALPVSLYTRFAWKQNLSALFHFLQLRMDSHAQEETRGYANAMAEMVQRRVPLAWQAFKEYRLHAVTLSLTELEALRRTLKRASIRLSEPDKPSWSIFALDQELREGGLNTARRAQSTERILGSCWLPEVPDTADTVPDVGGSQEEEPADPIPRGEVPTGLTLEETEVLGAWVADVVDALPIDLPFPQLVERLPISDRVEHVLLTAFGHTRLGDAVWTFLDEYTAGGRKRPDEATSLGEQASCNGGSK